MKLRAIAVDDEGNALERFSRLASHLDSLEILATFSDPLDAVEFLKHTDLDLVFLDIEMPKMNGLELAESIVEIKPSADIIFITAYDKYALAAFQVNAIGYLLKPIELDDLKTQVTRILHKRMQKPVAEKLQKLNVQCMGGFFVYKDSARKDFIKWRTAKAEELLALLIHSKGKSVTRDKIIDLLWPDMDYERAAKNLYATNFYVRDALGSLGFENVIVRHKDLYRVDLEQLEVDFLELEKIISEMNTKKDAADSWLATLDRYAGSYFENKDYLWTLSEQIWLQNSVGKLSVAFALQEMDTGNLSSAEAILGKVIRANPENEEVIKLMIDVLRLQGRSAETAVYRRMLDELSR